MSKKLVVKIGSSTLISTESSIDYEYLEKLAAQIACAKEMGYSPIIVTSAAIASGLEALGIKKRPDDMPSLQAAASVGQCALSKAYANALAKHGIVTSLVLLTRRDTADRTSYLHARDTLERLCELGVVPIINENDTISVEQIKFGDNDTLAALVASLVGANLMVIFSDIDGVYTANPSTNPNATLIESINRIDSETLALAGGAGSAVGSGGMLTKIQAARVLMAAGIKMIICHGRRENVLPEILQGKKIGTVFHAPHRSHEITPRKLWLALGDVAHGEIVVDAGAKNALIKNGSSLLCVGVKQIRGSFNSGDIVEISDDSGYTFARGRVACFSNELELACGRTLEQLKSNEILAPLSTRPVVHRDELVVFE